ncbi:MAG: hypothetical protein IJH64_04640, partial [Oscillospiraceae bacterium]|nr:hypothetical protein [Oscillospiraceae bacterium]
MKTINIRAFINAIKTEMQSRLYEYELTEQDIVKMNDITMHGLVARREGENAGATVYLDEPFKRFLKGDSIVDIADELSETILMADGHKPIEKAEDIDLSFDGIKDKLTLRLIDIEKNKTYLEEHPHRFIGAGLAVIAEINLGDDYSIVVNNSMAEEYDIIDLFDTAEENMRKLYPAQLISLEGAIFGDTRNILDGTDEDIEGVYTLMIGEGHGFGASTLAYKGVAERVRNLLGSGYFILPSSLHEVIILKDDGTARASDLKDMVVQANRSVVEPTDVLS